MDAQNTPLYNEHLKLNALMAPFAGWNMPIHYGSIIEETKYTRTNTSVFDICHMGEFFVKENPEKSSLDRIITVPVVKMPVGKCRYGFLLNDNGTVIDDLIVYRITNDEWMIVVNASNEERDAKTISKKLSKDAKFENRSSKTAKLDVQGPGSRAVMEKIAGAGIKGLKYFTFSKFDIYGGSRIISRTGYTGELGFEVYVDSDKAVKLWNDLLAMPGVKPAGLGARDILRLEAGLPLYGDEMTEDTTPLEACFERVLDYEKEFCGKQALLKQKKKGLEKILIGFMVDGRRTPRHTNKILIGGKEAGFVTSGVFSPHLNKGIGMGYINKGNPAVNAEEIEIVLDKGQVKARIEALPFVKATSIKN
jgi:aminomethyltransferase